MKYIIDDEVPVPPKKRGPGALAKYPFKLLKVKQSFFVPLEANDTIERLEARVKNAGFRASKDASLTFVCRARNAEEHKEVGVRVWRTA